MSHSRIRKFLSLALSLAMIAPQFSFAAGHFSESGGVLKEAPPVVITNLDVSQFPTERYREEVLLPDFIEKRPTEQIPLDFGTEKLDVAPASLDSKKEITTTQVKGNLLRSPSPLRGEGRGEGERGSLTPHPNLLPQGEKEITKGLEQLRTLIAAGNLQNISSIFDGSSLGAGNGDWPAPSESKKDDVALALEDAARRGSDLESWGLPNSVPIVGRYLRYAKLYRMSGEATDLGIALHEALKPLVASNPKLIEKLSQSQLEEALSLADKATHYSLNPHIPRRHAIHHFRKPGTSKSYDYPEWRDALIARARKTLAANPAPGEQSAGLFPILENARPTKILRNIFNEVFKSYSNLAQQTPKNEAEKQRVSQELKEKTLLVATFASITGQPLVVNGKNQVFSVTHDQISILVAELRRREVASSVIEALVRSFPLGESLWRMGIPELWEKGITGRGVKVAVLDNGIDPDHPDLYRAVTRLANFTRDRGEDTLGDHATPMADIIHTIAPDAEIMSYQVISNSELPGVALGEDELSQSILNALEQAKKDGAQIINMSMGIPRGYASDAISKKVDELSREGIIMIISAGNEGSDLPSDIQVRTPGTSKEAITVGAVDYHKALADFSSSGLVFNPENYSVDYKPDVHAFGVNIKAAAQLPKKFYFLEPAPYSYVSGTSPAAPHVSGVAALMLAAAQQAGIAATGGAVSAAAKSAVVESAQRIGKIRVLLNASEAISAFIKLLS